MKTDVAVIRTLELLEALNAAPEGRLPVAELCHNLHMSADELDACLTTISMLANRETGSRALVYLGNDEVVLEGDAARLATLRLTVSEGIAVASVLSTLNIDEATRAHIEHAMLPLGTNLHSDTQLSGAPSFGPWYPALQAAIQDGVRLRLGYRAHDDAEPRERLIDPATIEVASDTAYLIAWDLEHDGERRYRLDRVTAVTPTEDSVVPHAYSHHDVAASMAHAGEAVTLSLPADALADAMSWAGVTSYELDPGTEDRMLMHLNVTARAWLFDQVLAQGGDAWIVEPHALRADFLRYVQSLSRGHDATA